MCRYIIITLIVIFEFVFSYDNKYNKIVYVSNSNSNNHYIMI